MTIELAMLISVVSVAFAIYQGMTNLSRTKRVDDKNDATQLTTIIVKLESIGSGIAEIKNEMSNIKKDVKEDRERLIKVEESTKLAHERLNSCEINCKKIISDSRSV